MRALIVLLPVLAILAVGYIGGRVHGRHTAASVGRANKDLTAKNDRLTEFVDETERIAINVSDTQPEAATYLRDALHTLHRK